MWIYTCLYISIHTYTFSLLWPFWFVGFLVCGLFGLRPSRSVAVSVCGHSGLRPFRFVAVSAVTITVCGRYDLLYVQPPQACPRDKSTFVQARITKLGPVMQNNPVWGDDWPWLSIELISQNLPFWVCPCHQLPPIKARWFKWLCLRSLLFFWDWLMLNFMVNFNVKCRISWIPGLTEWQFVPLSKAWCNS